MTTDVDFAYTIEAANLERLAAFLPTIHARVLGRPANDNFVITTDTLQKVRFLNLKTDLGDVDVMREIPGVESFEGLWERAVPMDLGGFVVRVASLDDLIAMKRAANRFSGSGASLRIAGFEKTDRNRSGATGTAAANRVESKRGQNRDAARTRRAIAKRFGR